jgi:hypothetical protein
MNLLRVAARTATSRALKPAPWPARRLLSVLLVPFGRRK